MNAWKLSQAPENEPIALNFAGLFGDAPQATQSHTETTKAQIEYRNTYKQENALKRQIESLQGQEPARALIIKHEKEAADFERELSIYTAYQESIRKSEHLQAEMLRDIKAGVDLYSLFLKAAKTISLITTNKAFAEQVEEDIRGIYGRGLNYKPTLQSELNEAQERLQRLAEAEQRETGTNKERLQGAIKTHKEKIAELERLIAR